MLISGLIHNVLIQASESVHVAGFKSSDVFGLMQNALAENGAELTKKVGGVFLFKVAGEGGAQASWVVDAKNSGGSVRIAKDGKEIHLPTYQYH